MVYIIEQWDQVQLHFVDAPYTPNTNPLAVHLVFVGAEVAPPLAWSSPSVTVEYGAPLHMARAAANLSALTLTGADSADAERRSVFASATLRDLSVRALAQQSDIGDTQRRGVWASATPRQRDFAMVNNATGIQDRATQSQWNIAQPQDRWNFIASWIMATPFRDTQTPMGFYSVNLTGDVYDDAADFLSLLNTDLALTIALDASAAPYQPPAPTKLHFAFGVTNASRPIVPHDISARITARQAAPRDTHRNLMWGVGQSLWQDWNLPYPVLPNPVDPPDPIDPPTRKIVYLIMNTLQITDVATATPLDIQGVTISIDIDSLSWKFSGTVYGQGTLDLVRPDESGMKDVRVIVNTHEWVFSIERYTSDEKFPTSKFSISGVSRTQYMAAPFAPIRSYTNAIATTAAQAATAELEGTGFSLTWPTADDDDLPDWIIPTGALSYRDKTPAQVVAQIVTAAGGVMIPSMAADSWTIQPRYKSAPWQWDSVVPDTAIYIGMVRSRSARYEPAPAYDSCFVSGVSQGVSVDVQRTGSGGLNPMPDILDDLITATAPAISRGRNELAATGNKVVETLSVLIPELGAAPGVLRPGQIVTVTHDNPDSDYLALVIANSISVQKAGGAEIYQSVTLERRA